jgi:transposase
MEQIGFGETPKSTKQESLSKDDLLQRNSILEFELIQVIRENYKLRKLNVSDEQIYLIVQEQLESLNQTVYGASSERYKKPKKSEDQDKPKEPSKPRVKKPSERYPHLPVREQLVVAMIAPQCLCCGEVMTDSGMTEDSEQLTVIPKKYEIVLQKRVKYRCKCHGSLVTADAPARITPGSTYSDEMVVDVSLSKYCDLIPVERYTAMAERSGLKDLPPQSLIELTHSFADFVSPGYTLLKKDTLVSRVLHADETPHRMLEGSDKKTWYLWGFSNAKVCFLECHDTRSGDVASDILLKSQCEVLVTDVYSGYAKAIRIANQTRQTTNKPQIRSANCNAHARRYFFKCWPKYPEAAFYLDHYHEIYRLNSSCEGKPPPEVLQTRILMSLRFEEMKKKAFEEMASYPNQSKYGKALSYFLGNYEGLTFFLNDAEVPIDNNSQERLLRSHVVGRKTWYGTHSQRGALTAAILFSLVETCKLNQVNPREYFKHLVADLLAGNKAYTPQQLKAQKTAS